MPLLFKTLSYHPFTTPNKGLAGLFVIWFFSLGIFTSCNQDLVFRTKDSERKIVVGVDIVEHQKIRVQASVSQFITEDTNVQYLANATVKFFLNDTFIEELKTNSHGHALSTFVPHANDSIRVEISKEPYPKVICREKLPGKMILHQFDTLGRIGNNLGLRIGFFDEPLVSNYYFVQLRAYRWNYRRHSVTQKIIDSSLIIENLPVESVGKIFFSDNNIVSINTSFEIFNDLIFNGQAFTLDLNINSYNLQKTIKKSAVVSLEIEVRNLSKTNYDFLVATSLNRPIFGGPFAISSQIPNNIENGYGICTAYTIDKRGITMK
ncbi:MAG: hypothetical protein ACI8ZN_001899 [Bacteroidia bacterium]|jgi:hypothetical protein